MAHNLSCFQDLETNQDWNICIDDNGATLGRCVYACDGNESCEAECLDSFKSRQANCPCEVPTKRMFLRLVIVLQENCIGGCPCENYSCLETTTSPAVTAPTVPQTTTAPVANAVLVLSTYNTENKPMIIDFDGENLCFYNTSIKLFRERER